MKSSARIMPELITSNSGHVNYNTVSDIPLPPPNQPGPALKDSSSVAEKVFKVEKTTAIIGPEKRSHLSWRIRLAYSVGHVLNDLCASMWFSYFLLFVGAVLQFESRVSGSLLLLGQVADAIATPIIGIESDKTRDCCLCRYGKRKSWHLIGTICVVFTFPFVFTSCIICSNTDQWLQFFYYGAFIIVFQFGWAATQVAHVTLITDLTPDSNERVELNAYRHACTVASNICVYSITWMVLGFADKETKTTHLGPQDRDVFRNIVLSVVAIGCVFSTLFHVFVPERQSTEEEIAQNKIAKNKQIEDMMSSSQDIYRLRSCSTDIPMVIMPNMFSRKSSTPSPSLSRATITSKPADKPTTIQINKFVEDDANKVLLWRDWFKQLKFYQIGLIYMACRLFFNLSQVYTPLYLQETLFLPKESIAIIPLVTYVSGFVFSFVMRPLATLTGAKFILLFGCFSGIGACIWVHIGENDVYKNYEIYAVAFMFGITTTMLLIASLALTADMIGDNTTSGAFVFGAMSFLDKLANGIAVVLVQEFTPHRTVKDKIEKEPYWYYRHVLVYICGGALILIFILWLSLLRSNLGSRKPKSPD